MNRFKYINAYIHFSGVEFRNGEKLVKPPAETLLRLRNFLRPFYMEIVKKFPLPKGMRHGGPVMR